MDIQQAIAAPAPSTHVAGKQQAVDQEEQLQAEAGDHVSASAFSQLLQDLHQSPSLSPLQGGAAFAMTNADAPPVDANALASRVVLDDFGLLEGTLNIDSLVSQTQRLDAEHANLDVQDDRGLLSHAEMPLATSLMAAQTWGAQPQIAAGQNVATVAAGVDAALRPAASPEMPTALAAASAVLVQAGEVVEHIAHSAAEGMRGDDSSEGRVNLRGAWTLEDASQPLHPAFQRMMGHVEQWAAASAGLQPKLNERIEGGKSAAVTAEMLATGQGSGTRLTENAVKEAQQAQDAAFEEPAQAPVQDMRFWLQGKQQRAEVILEKDGQPVRVQVSVRGNEAHITFRSEQAQTRDLLDASLSQLRDMLAQQGVALSGVSVQAEGQQGQNSQGQNPRNPWDAAPVQHGQVEVPLEPASVIRRTGAQSLDLYA